MIRHDDLSQGQLFKHFKTRFIALAGNRKLKIYGQLHCVSGKRMKKVNRVFFVNEAEAIASGFRPCGRCMNIKYQRWKLSKKRVEKALLNLQF